MPTILTTISYCQVCGKPILNTKPINLSVCDGHDNSDGVFREHISEICVSCPWLSSAIGCGYPTVCYKRSIDGIPGYTVGDIVREVITNLSELMFDQLLVKKDE